MVTIYRKARKVKRLQKRILILCEGTTEKIYLDSLKSTLSRQVQRGIEINIQQSRYSEPVKIITEAKAKQVIANQEKQPYDAIWLVFDDDNRQNLGKLFVKAQKEGFSIAYTSISIELWVTLHFEQTAKTFTSAKEAENHLKRFFPQYTKTNPAIYDTLQPHYKSHALPNAGWLRQQKNIKDSEEAWKVKPITTMDILTQTLLNWNEEE